MQVNDIWRVYYFDEEWCKLQARKKSLKRLFEQCRDYQYDKVCGDMEAPIPEDEKMVSDQDLERIDSITMFEELKDMEEHFRFYYSRDRDQIKVCTFFGNVLQLSLLIPGYRTPSVSTPAYY